MRYNITSSTIQALVAIMSFALLASCSDSPTQDPALPDSTPAPISTAPPSPPDSTVVPAPESAKKPATEIRQGFPIPPKEPLAIPTLDSALNDLLSRIEAGEITEAQAARQTSLNRGNSVAITIHVAADSTAILGYLSENGITPRHTGESYIEVFLPLSMLADIAKQDGIIRIEMLVPPHISQAPAQSEPGNGPAVHGSVAWNDAGFTGKEIKVGVIDMGFDGAAQLLGTELPHTVKARCYGTDSDSHGTLDGCDGTHHGTIVAESIIDIAPEASLYLAAVRSRGDLADVVDWMIDENVSVINMSLSWAYDGPGDGTSPIENSALNTLSKAVSNGIVWISSAGNNGQSSWLGTPTDKDADGILEFNDTEQLTLNSTGPHVVQLRWAGKWDAESTDLDIHILDSNGDTVAQALNPQTGADGHIPYEIAFADATETILQVANNGDTIPTWVQVLVWSTSINESTLTGSISNPAESASPGMLTVGAANWQRTQDIEGYSSRGPAPDGRIKPSLVAAACGETTGPRPGYIFCGTSQAAPHVAGMAALVRQRFPDLTPQEIVNYLSQHTQERGAPGPDKDWGAGFSILPPPPPTSSPTPTPSITPTPTPTLTPSPTATATATPTPTPAPKGDRQALEALYHANEGDYWGNNANWMTNKPLDEWYGVEMNDQGRVETLHMKRCRPSKDSTRNWQPNGTEVSRFITQRFNRPNSSRTRQPDESGVPRFIWILKQPPLNHLNSARTRQPDQS